MDALFEIGMFHVEIRTKPFRELFANLLDHIILRARGSERSGEGELQRIYFLPCFVNAIVIELQTRGIRVIEGKKVQDNTEWPSSIRNVRVKRKNGTGRSFRLIRDLVFNQFHVAVRILLSTRLIEWNENAFRRSIRTREQTMKVTFQDLFRVPKRDRSACLRTRDRRTNSSIAQCHFVSLRFDFEISGRNDPEGTSNRDRYRFRSVISLPMEPRIVSIERRSLGRPREHVLRKGAHVLSPASCRSSRDPRA